MQEKTPQMLSKPNKGNVFKTVITIQITRRLQFVEFKVYILYYINDMVKLNIAILANIHVSLYRRHRLIRTSYFRPSKFTRFFTRLEKDRILSLKEREGRRK